MAWQPNYCTVEELAAFMRIGDNEDDVVLASAISAASSAIDNWSNRQFGKTGTEVRYYTPLWDEKLRAWILETDDIPSTEGLTLAHDDTAIVMDSARLRPRNAVVNGEPYTSIVLSSGSYRDAEIAVTGEFGWLEVPDAIKNATLMQASRFASRRDAPFGVAGAASQGSEVRLLAKVDPDVQVTIQKFYRWWGAV